MQRQISRYYYVSSIIEMTTAADFRNWLSPYVSELPDEQVAKLLTYLDMLLLWNRRMSLTSLIDAREIAQVLVGESVVAAARFGINNGRLADVGSGAGFPGLPLKILSPALEVTLIEPNSRKAVFLEEVIRRLGLVNAEVSHKRLEKLDIESESLDWVTSRGLAVRDEILEFSARALKRRGKVVLWGSEGEATILRKNEAWQWEKAEKLPGTDNRVILAATLRHT
jgi:16S rRNA (guanine527-N7)-methyltransferase